MNTAAYGHIALAPWSQWRNQAPAWWAPTALAAVALVLSCTWLFGDAAFATHMALLAFVLLGGGLWLAVFTNVLAQNDPRAARLVPGHARRLQVAVLVTWAVLSCLCGAVFGWAASPGWAVAAIAAIAAMALACVAIGVRWPLWWLLICTGGPLWLLARRFEDVEPLRSAFAAHHDAHPWLDAGVALAATAAALASTIGTGNAAHLQRATQSARASAFRRTTGESQGSAALTRLARWPFARCMAQVSAHPGGAVFAKALLVLKLPLHWSSWAGSAVVCIVLVASGVVFGVLHVPLETVRDALRHGASGWWIGLLASASLGAAITTGTRLSATRREQAVLMLLPGMLRGVALNRALACHQARQYVCVWALACAAAGIVQWWARGSNIPVAPFAAVTLPLCVWLWKDWSRVQSATSIGAFAPVMTVVAIAAVLTYAVPHDSAMADMGLLAASVAVTVVWGGDRWRRLANYPAALPVGRL